jgi:hypothetical protein
MGDVEVVVNLGSTDREAVARRLLTSASVVGRTRLIASSGRSRSLRASTGLRSCGDRSSTPRNTLASSVLGRARDGGSVASGPDMTTPI